MTRKEARAILGKKDRFEPGMARALCLLPWLNTSDDWRRVEALAVLGYKAPRALMKARGKCFSGK
jgi:hypothetical protein